MENKITIEENQTIEINGVVLTPEAIKTLKSIQDFENETIENFREGIANVVCLLAVNLDDFKKEDLVNINGLMTTISFCRDFINDLKKPIPLNQL